MKIKKIVSVILCLSLLFSIIFSEVSLNVSAATEKFAYIIGAGVNVRKTADTSATKVDTISYRRVTVTDTVGSWIKVKYKSGGKEISGYIYNDKDYVYINSYNPDTSFTTQLKNFPESYRAALKELNKKFPEWKFVPDYVNTSFSSSVEAQLANMRKQVDGSYHPISWRSMDKGCYDWNASEWIFNNGGWTGASKQVVSYYMDPRNFLNEDAIYMFLEQSYGNGTYTATGLKKIVKGTFLDTLNTVYIDGSNITVRKTASSTGTKVDSISNCDVKVTETKGSWLKISYKKGSTTKSGYISNNKNYVQSYIDIILEAGEQSGVSPYVIASKIIQEQGVCIDKDGKVSLGSLISGEYKGYEGYYNFFNFSASGSTTAAVIKNGLAYAKKEDWNTLSKAIINGAKKYSAGYIEIGQDTFYYQDFNVFFEEYLWHQYAQAVHDAYGKGCNLGDFYSEITDLNLIFRIPVYSSIPSKVSAKPVWNSKHNNYYFNSISVSGLTPSFYRYTYSYDLKVTDDTIIDVKHPSTASLACDTEFELKKGNNEITLKVKSQTGYTNSYKISVNASKACNLYINNKSSSSNSSNNSSNSSSSNNSSSNSSNSSSNSSNSSNNSSITSSENNNIDENNSSEGSELKISLGDINNDGKITISDMANVRLHLLKKYTLSGNAFFAADVNNDSKITISDMANIRLHLLGKYTIK